MKKLLVMALTSAMVFSLAGCAEVSAPAAAPAPAQEAAEAVEEAAEAVEEEVEEAAEEIAEEAEAVEEAVEDAVEEIVEEAGDDAVMSHADYVAAELDTPVTVETYVQAKQSWWDNKATVYTQDEDGAYFLYNMECPEDQYDLLVPGQKIKVSGYKSEWSGEVEIIDATFEIEDGSYIADALDVTDLLGTDELIDHQNEFVSFKGLTVEAAGQDDDGNDVAFLYNWDGSGEDGSDLYFNVSKDGETYTFTVESYLCDATTDVYAAVKDLEIGQTVDLEGFLYWYEGANPHITSVTVQ